MIAIIPPSTNSVNAAIDYLGGNNFDWSWIGEGSPGDFNLAPSGRKIDILPLIKKLSLELRQAYIDYVGEIGRQGSPGWWRTAVAEKNPYISQTFFHVCCVKACVEASAHAGRNSGYLLIVQNAALRQALDQNFRNVGMEARRFESTAPHSLNALRRLGRVLPYQAYFIFKNATKIFYARYKHRLHQSKPVKALKRSGTPVCIANIWIDLRAYSADTGEFKDVDFAGVSEHLRSRGKTVAGLANVQNSASYKKVVEYIARSTSTYLVPHSFLKLRDVISSAWRAFKRTPKRREFPAFAGLQISNLVFQDLEDEWYTQRETDHILMERWVERLKQAGIDVERFIYTFENHTWERVMCSALKTAYPKVKLIGYQPNGLPLLLLNYFISDAESDSVPLPHRIIANGDYPARVMALSGFGKDRIVLGGGLRQGYLQEILYGSTGLPTGKKQSGQILVTPSIGRFRSVELIRKVIEAFGGKPDLTLIIKCHPSMRFDQLEPFLRGLKIPANVRISTQPILELLPDVSVLVYNDGTFPAAEALAFGIPVVFVEPEYGLSLDSLDGFPDARQVARTPPEISAAVGRILALSDAERQKGEWRGVVRQLVGKVTEQTFGLFAE